MLGDLRVCHIKTSSKEILTFGCPWTLLLLWIRIPIFFENILIHILLGISVFIGPLHLTYLNFLRILKLVDLLQTMISLNSHCNEMFKSNVRILFHHRPWLIVFHKTIYNFPFSMIKVTINVMKQLIIFSCFKN